MTSVIRFADRSKTTLGQSDSDLTKFRHGFALNPSRNVLRVPFCLVELTETTPSDYKGCPILRGHFGQLDDFRALTLASARLGNAEPNQNREWRK